MPRKKGTPRKSRIELTLSEEEKATIEAAARSKGLQAAVFCRVVALAAANDMPGRDK